MRPARLLTAAPGALGGTLPGMLDIGLLFIVVGIVLWLTAAPGIGWILIVVGVVLLLIGALTGGTTRLRR